MERLAVFFLSSRFLSSVRESSKLRAGEGGAAIPALAWLFCWGAPSCFCDAPWECIFGARQLDSSAASGLARWYVTINKNPMMVCRRAASLVASAGKRAGFER